MKHAIAAFAGLTALCAASASLAREETILPGYWQSENKVGFPLNDDSTSLQCVTAQKVEQFLSGPSSRNYKCTYDTSQVGGGSVKASGSCVDKSGLESNIAVEGTYTPTSFELQAQLRVNVGGLGIPISASTKARRIADECPADAPR